VRVNFGGRRYVGVVALPEGVLRMSDVLNDGSHFLHLEDAHTRDGAPAGGLCLNKGSISYIQALEESSTGSPSLRREGGFVTVDVAMATLDHVIRGRLFVPDGASAAEVLNDERNFISLRDAEVVGTPEKYPFLAICKAQVVSVAVTESVGETVGG